MNLAEFVGVSWKIVWVRRLEGFMEISSKKMDPENSLFVQ